MRLVPLGFCVFLLLLLGGMNSAGANPCGHDPHSRSDGPCDEEPYDGPERHDVPYRHPCYPFCGPPCPYYWQQSGRRDCYGPYLRRQYHPGSPRCTPEIPPVDPGYAGELAKVVVVYLPAFDYRGWEICHFVPGDRVFVPFGACSRSGVCAVDVRESRSKVFISEPLLQWVH